MLQDGTFLRLGSEDLQKNIITRDLSERETVIRQKPLTSDWEQSRVTQIAAIKPEMKKFGILPAVILTALAMCFIFGGITLVWWSLSYVKDLSDTGSENTNLSNSQNRDNANSNKQSNKTNSNNNELTGWEPIKNNVSLNGENLTYYRGTTAERCQADCDANPKCKGFTFIRAGAYYAEDPPMCYLATKVTGATTHTCCISAIKSESNRTHPPEYP